MMMITPGRTVQLGPDWPESDATLAFDACSGDYWVLDGLGRFIVERLLQTGPLSAHSLWAAVEGTPAIAHAISDVEAGLVSLVESGLLQTECPASD